MKSPTIRLSLYDEEREYDGQKMVYGTTQFRGHADQYIAIEMTDKSYRVRNGEKRGLWVCPKAVKAILQYPHTDKLLNLGDNFAEIARQRKDLREIRLAADSDVEIEKTLSRNPKLLISENLRKGTWRGYIRPWNRSMLKNLDWDGVVKRVARMWNINEDEAKDIILGEL